MLVKLIGAICAMLVVAVLIVAVGMWRGLIPVPGVLLVLLVRGGEPEHTARYYPPDTLAYSWATLVPSGGQLEELQDIWGQLDDSRAFRDVVDSAQDEFEEETGIDFEAGVVPWIGPEFSLGLLGVYREREEWVVAAMVGVRDRDAAEHFLSDWLEYIEDESHTEFRGDTYRGFDIVVSDDGHQAYALTDDWLVFATDERALEDILVRVGGDEDTSLASEDSFREARSQMLDRRLASVYVSSREAEDLLDEWFGGGSTVVVGEDYLPDWVVASAGLVESGIVMEVTAPFGIEHPLEVADLADPSGLLPSDTLGFVAMTFDPEIDHWRSVMEVYEIGDVLAPDEIDGFSEAIEEFTDDVGSLNLARLDADDGLDAVLDLGLDAVALLTGIDLEDDLFDHLAGEMIVAVGDIDFAAIGRSPARNAVDAVVMLSYLEGSRDDLEGTMDDVADLLVAPTGLDTDTQDVGADDRAVVLDLGSLTGERIGYRPGYVLHDGYLTLGSTDGVLEGVVERQNGDANALSANEEYLGAIRSLPEKRQFLGYVDMHRIIRQLEARDLGLSRDQHRILEESIGVIAMSSYIPHCVDYSEGYECELPAGAGVGHHTVVLTLFPK